MQCAFMTWFIIQSKINSKKSKKKEINVDYIKLLADLICGAVSF
jgi:hypothetical protein